VILGDCRSIRPVFVTGRGLPEHRGRPCLGLTVWTTVAVNRKPTPHWPLTGWAFEIHQAVPGVIGPGRVYLTGREPVMRMSTSRLALCCQSGPDATWETPISARSRSNGSRSLRMSRLLIARFTNESIAPWI